MPDRMAPGPDRAVFVGTGRSNTVSPGMAIRPGTALVVGSSDGIGLALARRLLDMKRQVRGLSRSPAPITHDAYDHHTVDVTATEFTAALVDIVREPVDLCVYCAGIGEALDFDDLPQERRVFEVNLMGAVKTIEVVLPTMIRRKVGHFVALSSIADKMIYADAPSYAASKAGLTSYLECMALAAREHGVAVTNVRFGFVDTKMAKGDRKPLMMTTDKAVDHLLHCLERRPIRYSRPRLMTAIVRLHRLVARLKM